jgi:hypothetical protein
MDIIQKIQHKIRLFINFIIIFSSGSADSITTYAFVVKKLGARYSIPGHWSLIIGYWILVIYLGLCFRVYGPFGLRFHAKAG